MLTLLIIQFFFFGMVWGSFLNMAVYRVKHEMNFSGRSFCDHTKERLSWKDLIPVFSYIFYKGKCRLCSNKLPLLYPVVEILTGITMVLGLLTIIENYPTYTGLNLLITFYFILFFIFFAVYDYLYWEVNVRAIQYALIGAFIFCIIGLFLDDSYLIISSLSGLIAGLIAALIIYLIVRSTKGSGMGEGDIFLMAFAGLAVGLDGLIPLFLISSVSGSIIGLIKAFKIKKFHGVQIQFVPFISIAALVVLFWNKEILKFLNLEEFFELINSVI